MSILKRVVSTLRPGRSIQPVEQNQQPPSVSPPDAEVLRMQAASRAESAVADEVARVNEKIKGTKEAIKDTKEAIEEEIQRIEDLKESKPTKGDYESSADYQKAVGAYQKAVQEAEKALADLNEEVVELMDELDELDDQLEELSEQTDTFDTAGSEDVHPAGDAGDDAGATLGQDDEANSIDRLTREDVFGEADAIEGEVTPPFDDQAQALYETMSGIHKDLKATQTSIVRNMLSEEPDTVENYDLSGLEPPGVVAPPPPDASVVPGNMDLEESLQQASEATPFATEVLQSIPDEGMIDNPPSVDTGEGQLADGETPELGSPVPAVAVFPASSKGGESVPSPIDVCKTPEVGSAETAPKPYPGRASETGTVSGTKPATVTKAENPAGQSGDAVTPLEGASGVAASSIPGGSVISAAVAGAGAASTDLGGSSGNGDEGDESDAGRPDAGAGSHEYIEDSTDDASSGLSAELESAPIPDLLVEDRTTLAADVSGGEVHLEVDDTVEQADVDLHAPNVIKDGLQPDDGIPDLLRAEESLGFLGDDPALGDEPPTGALDEGSDLLDLQNDLQGENRQFTSSSNIMKAHTDVGNSTIDNIRGDEPSPEATEDPDPPVEPEAGAGSGGAAATAGVGLTDLAAEAAAYSADDAGDDSIHMEIEDSAEEAGVDLLRGEGLGLPDVGIVEDRPPPLTLEEAMEGVGDLPARYADDAGDPAGVVASIDELDIASIEPPEPVVTPPLDAALEEEADSNEFEVED